LSGDRLAACRIFLEGEVVGDGAFGFDGFAVEEGRFEFRAFGGVFGGIAEHGVAGGCFGVGDVTLFVEVDLDRHFADDARLAGDR